MAKTSDTLDTSETLATPLGDLIAAIGRGLAEAQQSLDLATIETLKAVMGGKSGDLEMLRRLGYQPTWYRIPELNAELTLSLSVTGTSTTTESVAGQTDAGPGRIRVYASTMDANYTNRYDYDLNAASVIKFRIVAVPPSTQASDVKIVPKVDRLPFHQASARLVELGIPFDVPTPAPRDDEIVQSTVPEAGEILSTGQRVALQFDRG